ncbi:hypothetical protein BDZ89DRAFT_403253 [Hymenopellis radicata]|nr:hypothetical protein BDZ89DRAFT_403253 [Hymenopellis radicata]
MFCPIAFPHSNLSETVYALTDGTALTVITLGGAYLLWAILQYPTCSLSYTFCASNSERLSTSSSRWTVPSSVSASARSSSTIYILRED